MNGDWKCLFRAPELEFERQPGGKVWLKGDKESYNSRNYCLDKMRMWGYFVKEGIGKREKGKSSAFSVKECDGEGVKVLWGGRLLKWKRVDTIIRAVGECAKSKKITLDIYGLGPEKAKLKKIAKKYGDIIRFYPPVPISEVRNLMRVHDIYVLSSNAYEGWGAVVSEALEEGMRVIGTYEAGSSATILPESNLFHAGDWRRLKELLEGDVEKVGIGEWTAKVAARVLLENS
jgi:glycosyltransferase involved in cell wall biosynthesis